MDNDKPFHMIIRQAALMLVAYVDSLHKPTDFQIILRGALLLVVIWIEETHHLTRKKSK